MSPPAPVAAATPPRIHLLPRELVDQIAAGEVVERPASVVKELCENALDAGARLVEVDVEGGGRGLIRVTDDGCGMTPDDLRLAIERHATSKIRAQEDLFALRTMGFRGEALPSIASVSRMTIVSRPATALEAYELDVTSGRGGPAGARPGTRIEVRDLLHNVPARLKFLKADATETAHVSEAVVRLALAFPEVHFRLRASGRVLVDLPPHPSLVERARLALGRRVPARLHAGSGEESGVRVTACLGAPDDAGTTSRGTYLVVNRRFVRDRSLAHAVAMGYGELVERGRYPLAVVHVEVPPALVDVNVHPQKTEVRFARPQEVQSAVRHAVHATCARAPWLSSAGAAGAAPLRVYSLPPERDALLRERAARYATDEARVQEALGLFGARRPGEGAPVVPALTDEAPAASGPGSESTGFFASLTYLGQLHRTYLVCQAEGELVLIDQHAAHERVAFERLRTAWGERRIATQRLLFPCTLDLDPRQAAVAVAEAPLVAELGFDLEPFGGPTFAVKAVPELLAGAPVEEVVTRVLDELGAREAGEPAATGGSVCGDGPGAAAVSHVLATMACHSVVRAGDVLDAVRARALLGSMDGIDFRAHCPHGRPVLLRMSLGELERRFGRT